MSLKIWLGYFGKKEKTNLYARLQLVRTMNEFKTEISESENNTKWGNVISTNIVVEANVKKEGWY